MELKRSINDNAKASGRHSIFFWIEDFIAINKRQKTHYTLHTYKIHKLHSN